MIAGFRRFLSAIAANTVSGLIVGAILAGGFWFFGAIAGAMYGCLAGLVVGILAAIRSWPVLSIVVACTAQSIGALAAGFGMAWVDPSGGPPDHAVVGILGGGGAGVVLAEVVSQMGFHAKQETDGPACSRCGYDLRGNVSGRCPECGTQVTDASGSGLH